MTDPVRKFRDRAESPASEAQFQAQIAADVAGMARDPLSFVLYNYPWGQGTLADYPEGPDEWQRDLLAAIRDGLMTADQAVRAAIASGHGIGKSALVAWLCEWALATFEDARGVVTANTDTQLRTKTWPELTKWHNMGLCKFMFEVTATAMFSTQPGHDKNWRIDLVPWSERNTEAFAGLHNKGRRIILIFDEASAIPEIIWETAEGALTDSDTEIVWFVAGNPTRNTGRFRECFGRFRHRWITRQIDSRTARVANKTQIQQWVDDYGEDSDFVRIRVRGVFPRAADNQFIPTDIAEAAAARLPARDDGAPLILGVDPARFGSDQSVIYCRIGRDGKSVPPRKFRGIDTMQLSGFVAESIEKLRPSAVFIDGNGIGGGVVDRLKQLGYPVYEVQAGGKARNDRDYANKRAECWGEMREWLKTACIGDDRELITDLTGVEYGFDRSNRIQLESKDDMLKRGLGSPDTADALSVTFAQPVARADVSLIANRPAAQICETNYPVFG